MKILRLLSFLVLGWAITACQTVYFAEPQPEGKRALTSLPKRVQGTYPLMDDERLQVVVTADGIMVPNGESDEVKLITLGEEAVLKKFAGHYILSLKDNDRWDVYAINRSGTIKQLILEESEYYKIDELLGDGFMARSKTTPGGSKVIAPSKQEFRKLLKKLFAPID